MKEDKEEKEEQPHQDEHWKLTCQMQWTIKPGAPDRLQCPTCKGKRSFQVWGGYPDEWEDCSECNGNGTIVHPDQRPKPKTVPDDLFELMKRTWLQYFSDKGDEAWTA